ncbi:hypothetical protein N5E30_11920 [Pseudomonas chengduensis]|uniref:hypothetical protein n=1 Tax=Pseudomonas sihuiensis TaxID=1274359 RepID=UPI0012FDF6C4|nr:MULTISPECIES: hypothetical protein [Pseudomonas]MDH1622985.1 hypothetical protein [Pseudomonas chengduensis]MDH1682284.1 hypothetical protein [Pseudomonas chengduensis]
MPETPNPEELIKWAGWLLSLVLGLIGIGVTFSVLYIRIRHAEKLAQRKERHDAIDNALRLLTDFEDKSLDYWTAKDSKYTKAHIITAQQRLSFSIKQLSRITASNFPDKEMAEIRKSATLDMETKRRPISANSERILRLSISTSKMQNLSLFAKNGKS